MNHAPTGGASAVELPKQRGRWQETSSCPTDWLPKQREAADTEIATRALAPVGARAARNDSGVD